MGKLSTHFENIYKEKNWGGNNSKIFFSGDGSSISPTIPFYIDTVKTFFTNLTYKPNVIDIGCGDFNIGKELVPFVNNYLAVDVVDSLIQHNKSMHNYSNVTFETLDITNSPSPTTDVIILRHVFQHLSNKDILDSLRNIYLKSKYLIITEGIPLTDFTPNLDIESMHSFRPVVNNSGVDILLSPFNFPIEEELITLLVKHQQPDGEFLLKDKTVIYKQKINN
jgi:hypothetical protein